MRQYPRNKFHTAPTTFRAIGCRRTPRIRPSTPNESRPRKRQGRGEPGSAGVLTRPWLFQSAPRLGAAENFAGFGVRRAGFVSIRSAAWGRGEPRSRSGTREQPWVSIRSAAWGRGEQVWRNAGSAPRRFNPLRGLGPRRTYAENSGLDATACFNPLRGLGPRRTIAVAVLIVSCGLFQSAPRLGAAENVFSPSSSLSVHSVSIRPAAWRRGEQRFQA